MRKIVGTYTTYAEAVFSTSKVGESWIEIDAVSFPDRPYVVKYFEA